MPNWRRLLLSAVVGMAAALGFAAAAVPAGVPHCQPSDKPVDAFQTPSPQASPGGNTNAGLKASTVKINGRVHYYQIPQAPRGTVVFLPGCMRTGHGFWPFDAATCKQCAGLTEDVCFTKQALARGYAMFVPTPVKKGWCWSAKSDVPTAFTTVDTFLKSHGLDKKPVVLMGASSGGSLMVRYMIAAMADKGYKILGAVPVVGTNPEVPDIVRSIRSKRYPPIVWVVMDTAKEIRMGRDRVAQYKRFAPAAMALAPARKVTNTYFSDRHPLITPAVSAQMAAAFRKLGVIKADGSIAGDPRNRAKWVAQLPLMVPFLRKNPHIPLAPMDRAPILQALMVAQSAHDHVCDFLTAALVWFESGAPGHQAGFDRVAAKYRVTKPGLLRMTRQKDGSEPAPAQAYAYGSAAQTQNPTIVPPRLRRRALLTTQTTDTADTTQTTDTADTTQTTDTADTTPTTDITDTTDTTETDDDFAAVAALDAFAVTPGPAGDAAATTAGPQPYDDPAGNNATAAMLAAAFADEPCGALPASQLRECCERKAWAGSAADAACAGLGA
jgi:hypothetical protein